MTCSGLSELAHPGSTLTGWKWSRPGRRLCCLPTWAFMLCLEVKSLLQLETGHRLFGAPTSCRCFLEWM